MSPPVNPNTCSKIERAQGLATDHARLESRRIALDRFDHQVGYLLTMIVPRAAVRQLRSDMLAEQACNVRPARRQRFVQSRRNDQLDDRLAAPSVHSRVAKGAIHVGETGRKDDAGGVMIGCTSCPGSAIKLGSSESATFIRKVPEPQRQARMRRRKAASSAPREPSSYRGAWDRRLRLPRRCG